MNLDYYNLNDIKLIQSFRMRILKELYNNMMDEKDVLADLEVVNYEQSRVYLRHLYNKGLITLDMDLNGSATSTITAKGIDEIERYMIENEEYLRCKITAFDLDEEDFSVFVRKDNKPVPYEETARQIDEVKKALGKLRKR